MIESLVERASELGHRVEFLPLPGKSGLLMPGGLILINSKKHEITQRAALAHELGHVHYGHDWRNPHSRERDEVQADSYAAELLISSAEYAVAEVMYDDIGSIATALEVPLYLLKIWQSRHSHLAQYADV